MIYRLQRVQGQNVIIMDLGDTGTEFEMPSPKRLRVQEQRADNGHQFTKSPLDPETAVDDMDDLYGTSISGTPTRTDTQQESTMQLGISQQQSRDPPKFQLPGLGFAADEGRSAKPQEEAKPVGIRPEDEGSKGENTVHHARAYDEKDTEFYVPGQKSSTNSIKTSLPTKISGLQPPPINKPGEPAKAALEISPHNTRSSAGDNPSEPLTSSSITMSAAEDLMVEQGLTELGRKQLGNIQEPEFDTQWTAPESPQQVKIANVEKGMSETQTQSRIGPNSVEHKDVASSLVAPGKNDTEPNKMDLDAEFEMDSSPIVSSSDGSSESSSSDDSDDYEMLDPAEQARRLMQEDGGSDVEGAQDIGASKAPLRTLNEKPDEIVPKPNVTITADMKVQELGDVENLVENLVLIKAKTSGEYQVLETGSVLCLGDRSVIGVVAETLGRVHQPYYSVRFTNAGGIAEAGISKGTMIFYSEQHSTTVFTQPLKAFKGSDASNLHDEEVADDEIEFSDDEAEAEYKKRQKQQKQAKREGRSSVPDGFSRGPGGRGGNRGRGRGRGDRRGGKSNDQPRDTNSGGISYDDMDTDEPYTPLARPSNLHEMMGQNVAPLENQNRGLDAARRDHDHSAGNYGRGSGDRGRGDRSRGYRGTRGDRRGRGGNENSGYSGYPQNDNHYTQPQYPPSPMMELPSFYPSQNQYQAPNPHPYAQQQAGYQPMHSSPQRYGNNYPTPPNQQHCYQNQNSNPQSPVPNIPPGAFINPAFFAPAYQNRVFPPNAVSTAQNPQNGLTPSPNHPKSNGPASPGSNGAYLAAQERLKLLQDLSHNTRGN